GVLGVALGLEVGAHGLAAGVGAVGAQGRDHDVAVDAGGPGGVDQLHRRAVVDGALAGGPAPRARPGGEHDGVGAPHRVGQRPGALDGLEVEHHGLGPRRLDVGDVVRVAEDGPGAVAVAGQQALEAAGDLAVAAGDGDVHGAQTAAAPGARGTIGAR